MVAQLFNIASNMVVYKHYC